MWDERFRDGARPYGSEPSLYVREKVGLLRAGGRILVPGDGGGRNGVWLARQGFDVEIWDFSPEGLSSAQRWAAACGVTVTTRLVDLLNATCPEAFYDAVVSVYVHLPSRERRRIQCALLGAIKPGGYLILEGFHEGQLGYASGGPRDADWLYTEASLLAETAGHDVVEVRRDLVELDESKLHCGPGLLLRACIRRVER